MPKRPPPVARYVGAHVQRLRAERGFTQEALAERLSVDVRYLRRVERGDVNIGVDTLAKLAVVLNVPASSLVTAVEQPNRAPGRPTRRNR